MQAWRIVETIITELQCITRNFETILDSATKYLKSANEQLYNYQDLIWGMSKREFAREFFFLSATWLPHGQPWAILEGTASLPMLITAYVKFWLEGYQ